MARRKQSELTFQRHIADFLVREHGYEVLEQAHITDTEHFIAEDLLWAFLTATQAATLKKLTTTTARPCWVPQSDAADDKPERPAFATLLGQHGHGHVRSW